MKKHSTIFAVLLAALLAASVFAGCNPASNTDNLVPESSASTEVSKAESVAESETTSTDEQSAEGSGSESKDNSATGGTSGTGNSNTTSAASSSSDTSTSSKPSSSSTSSTSKPSTGSNGSSSTQTSKPSHTHSYSKKVTKPTCTAQGYTTYTCSCGSSYTDNYTKATGHSWSSWKTTKKATTTSTGLKERTCSGCGKKETKSIAKLSSGSGSGSSSGGSSSGSGSGSGSSSSGVLKQQKAVYSYKGLDPYCSVTLVDLLNEERAKRGLCKLEWTADLYYQDYKDGIMTDEEWGSGFIVNGKFDPYNCPEVKSVLNAAQVCADRQRAGHDGVSASCVGEVWGYGSLENHLRESIKAYLASPGHYDLLMSPGSHRVTAAYAVGANGHVYTAIICGG